MNTDIKILLADDSAFMRKILIGILEEIGFSNFIEAANGKEAIEKFESESSDLVMLDVVMPEVDGLEAVKELGGKVKVLMVSAVGQDTIIAEAKASGALGYIVKPFDKAKVVSELERILS